MIDWEAEDWGGRVHLASDGSWVTGAQRAAATLLADGSDAHQEDAATGQFKR